MTDEVKKYEEAIGIIGVESIRFGGRSIDQLPIAEAALAKQQMPLAQEAEKQAKAMAIKAGSPKQSVRWLKAKIKECRANIKRIETIREQQNSMISEYTSLIRLCEFRDKQLEQTDDPERIKELKKMVPPYKIDAMEQQIVQSNESIERAEAVIAKEQESIQELQGVLMLAMKRDADLQNLGFKP